MHLLDYFISDFRLVMNETFCQWQSSTHRISLIIISTDRYLKNSLKQDKPSNKYTEQK